jgi:hypothetical protein
MAEGNLKAGLALWQLGDVAIGENNLSLTDQVGQVKHRADSIASLVKFGGKKSNMHQVENSVGLFLGETKFDEGSLGEKRVAQKFLSLIKVYTRNVAKVAKDAGYRQKLGSWLAGLESKVEKRDLPGKNSRRRLGKSKLNSNDALLAKLLKQKNLPVMGGQNLNEFSVSEKPQTFFARLGLWLTSIPSLTPTRYTHPGNQQMFYNNFLASTGGDLPTLLNLERRTIINQLESSVFQNSKSFLQVPTQDLLSWSNKLARAKDTLELYDSKKLPAQKKTLADIEKFTKWLNGIIMEGEEDRQSVPILKKNLELFFGWYKDFKNMNGLTNDVISLPEIEYKTGIYGALLGDFEKLVQDSGLKSWLKVFDYKNLAENLRVDFLALVAKPDLSKPANFVSRDETLLDLFQKWTQ